MLPLKDLILDALPQIANIYHVESILAGIVSLDAKALRSGGIEITVRSHFSDWTYEIEDDVYEYTFTCTLDELFAAIITSTFS